MAVGSLSHWERGGVRGYGFSTLSNPLTHPTPLPHKGVSARLRRAMGERERTARIATKSFHAAVVGYVSVTYDSGY